jgi:hypothetical protein
VSRRKRSDVIFVPGPSSPRRNYASTEAEQIERWVLPPVTVSLSDSTGSGSSSSGSHSDTTDDSSASSTDESGSCSEERSDATGDTSHRTETVAEAEAEAVAEAEAEAEAGAAAGAVADAGAAGAVADAGAAGAVADAGAGAVAVTPALPADNGQDLSPVWNDLLAESRRQMEEAQRAFEQLVEAQQRQRTELERQMRLNFTAWLQQQSD